MMHDALKRLDGALCVRQLLEGRDHVPKHRRLWLGPFGRHGVDGRCQEALFANGGHDAGCGQKQGRGDNQAVGGMLEDIEGVSAATDLQYLSAQCRDRVSQAAGAIEHHGPYPQRGRAQHPALQ